MSDFAPIWKPSKPLDGRGGRRKGSGRKRKYASKQEADRAHQRAAQARKRAQLEELKRQAEANVVVENVLKKVDKLESELQTVKHKNKRLRDEFQETQDDLQRAQDECAEKQDLIQQLHELVERQTAALYEFDRTNEKLATTLRQQQQQQTNHVRDAWREEQAAELLRSQQALAKAKADYDKLCKLTTKRIAVYKRQLGETVLARLDQQHQLEPEKEEKEEGQESTKKQKKQQQQQQQKQQQRETKKKKTIDHHETKEKTSTLDNLSVKQQLKMCKVFERLLELGIVKETQEERDLRLLNEGDYLEKYPQRRVSASRDSVSKRRKTDANVDFLIFFNKKKTTLGAEYYKQIEQLLIEHANVIDSDDTESYE